MTTLSTPLAALAANITASTAPTIGKINVYDATAGALTPTLAALSGLNVGARMIVQKAESDTTANTVTLACAGSDTFDTGTTTRTLRISGESFELQVVSVSGTKHWKVVGDVKPLVALDARYGGSGGGGAVSSVAGRTGAVTLTKADVGLGNLDNVEQQPLAAGLTALAALSSPATKLTNASTRVLDARDYGVIADGAAHNNVANLLDCFAAAHTAGTVEVLLPAGTIYTGDANLGSVTANSGNTYTNNGGIPLPINQAMTVTGHGKNVTILQLSTGFTRGFDFGPYSADGQIYRDITIRGITFDRNSVSGTTIGPLTAVTANVTIPGDGTPTVLPGVSATAWKNAKWAYTPSTNAGTLRGMAIWVGVSGSNVVAMNYYGTSYTLNSGDQIGARLSEHVIVGTYVWGGDGFSGGKAMTIKNILVDSCSVANAVTTSPTYGTLSSDRSYGVGVSLANGGSQATVANFVVRDTIINGGAYGCAVIGAAGTFLDNVWYEDCFHDTMLTPTMNYESANFLIGYNAWVGHGGAVRCIGRRSGDVTFEIDQPWEGYEEDCTWEDGYSGIYRTSFQPPARTASGPLATTLNNGGTLTSGATTCTVTALPAGVDRSGLVLIDAELVWYQVTNLAGTTWNIWRGINGSTAASHTTSAAVTFVETHKTRVYSTRSTVKNQAVMAAGGTPGRAYLALTNSNLPLPPLTIRDPHVTILGGNLNEGQILFQQGWCPDVDIQGLRGSQSSLLSSQASTVVGSGISYVSPGTAALVANSVPAPAQKLTGRNNKLHVHGGAPNTSSGSYTAFRVWDGFWKLDFDVEAEVSLADIANTNVAYLQNWGAYSGSLVIAPGSRVGVIGRVPTEVGVTAPIGLFIGSTTYVTIQSLINAALDLTSNFTPTAIDATQTAKVIAGVPIAGVAANGTPSSTTFLRGDGAWSTPPGGSGGNMSTGTYDPAGIDQQVLGLTAAQSPTNKNLTDSTNTFPTLNQNTTGSAAKLTTPRLLDGQSFDGSANVPIIGPATVAATSKTTPVDADLVPMSDSAASGALKSLSFANLKAWFKSYYDGVVSVLTNKDLTSGTNTFPTFNQNTTGNAATATTAGKWTTPRTVNGVSVDGSANVEIPTIAGGGADYLPTGFASMSRIAALNEISPASGVLELQYFTADKTATVSTIRALSWGTAAGATPTKVRFGIFSVDGSGNLTLIASTPNDTTLFSGTYQTAIKALSASVTLNRGSRYALGFLIVSTAAMPTILGAYIADAGASPRIAGTVPSQTDLPSTITAASVTGTPATGHYMMAY